jgi:4-azaleucine resistance transporter AzlC
MAQPTRQSEFWRGARTEAPILLGTVPFGIIYGIIAVQSGIPPQIVFAMSSIVFAGSAQVIGAELITGSVPALVVLITTFIVNLRHALYSASLQPFVKHLSPLWKIGLAYLLTDEAYVVAIAHYTDPDAPELRYKHWYYLGAGLLLWSSWQVATFIGVFFSSQLSAESLNIGFPLEFALPLTFIALVVPALRDRPAVLAAAAAGLTAVVVSLLEIRFGSNYRLSLLTAALVGVVVGVLAENAQTQANIPPPIPPSIPSSD